MVRDRIDQLWPAGVGEQSSLIRTKDWQSTSLGSTGGWPQSLRIIVDLILSHELPMLVLWGRDHLQIYNDAYSSISLHQYPDELGQPAHTCRPEEWHVYSPIYERVLRGETVTIKDVPYGVRPDDPAENIRVDLCHSPIRGSEGEIVGLLVTLIDVTAQHRAGIEHSRTETLLRERKQALAAELTASSLLRDLAERLVTEENVETMYDEILSAAISIMNSDAGTVQVYEPATRSLVLLVSRNFDRTMTDHFHSVDADSRTACGTALRNGERTFIEFRDDDVDEACVMHVHAGYRSAQATPLVSRKGKPLGMLNTHWRAAGHRPTERQLRFVDLLARQAADLIEQRQSEKILRDSEERLRQFGEASQDVLWIRDVKTMQWSYLTPAFETIYGLDREEALSGNNYRSWMELIVPEDREHATEAMRRVRNGEHVTFEYRIHRPSDGDIRWLRNTDFPITNQAGEVTLIGGIGHDITEIKLNQARLEQSEERLRSATEVGRLGLWDWNVTTGDIHWSDEHFRMDGYAVGEVTPSYDAWASRIHPDDRPATEAALAHAMNTREEFMNEFRTVHPDGSIHWLYGRGRFFYGEDGQALRMVGTMVETTERREWEERQKVLVAELQHRTRNLLGVVRSMADKTARSSSDLPSFRARFRDRVDALARVQGLLSRLGDSGRVTFDDLITTELRAMDGGSECVTLHGPLGVRLRSSTVQTLAMALHELATNAVKYGALGQSQARLAITWTFEAEGPGEKPWLHIDWRESGVSMPVQSAVLNGGGQGRDLIERALPYQLSAKTTYTLSSDGAHCTISIPVSETMREGRHG